jgi:lipopolysaccharide/colanic/teichoic acid biosynthesis glycosyltransferase
MMQKFFSEAAKRFTDIFFALLALALLSPILLLIALRIKQDSPGPVIFRGQRLGKHGKPFQILKFRTMHEAAESYRGPAVTARDDPRVTPFGRWLRDTKLNELPQFWNVLRGDMSLVGPRPEDPSLVLKWPEEIRREILSVRPGITSPASVLYRDEESLLMGGRLMDTYLESIMPSKQRLDQLYVRHRSFWLDLDVILWTFLVLVPSFTDYQPPEGLLFWGPIAKLFRRHVTWFMADTLVSLAAIAAAGLFFRYFGPLDVGWTRAVISALIFALLFSLTAMLFGVNRVEWSSASGEDILVLVPPTAIAGGLALLVNNLMANPTLPDQPFIPNGMILLAVLLAFLGFITVRFRSRLLLGLTRRWLYRWSPASMPRERVLVVGGGESGQLASLLLSTSSYASHFDVVGFVDDNLFKQGTRIRGVEVVGKRQDIADLVERMDIGLILFAIHNISPGERRELLAICQATPARTILFPDIPAALDSLVVEKIREDARNQANRKKQDVNGYRGGDTQPLSDAALPGEAGLPGKRMETHSPSNFAVRPPGSLPCDLCLVKTNPLQVERWLARLEKKATAGDLAGLEVEIKELRRELRPHIQAQVQAAMDVEDIQPASQERQGE